MQKILPTYLTAIICCLLVFKQAGAVTHVPTTRPALTLSLSDAISLAVRTNPNVQSSQLSYELQQYNLNVQEWQFQPHFSFQVTAAASRSGTQNNSINSSYNTNVQPGMTLQTPIGTQLTFTGANHTPNLSLQIMQPLMRGFGTAVVEAALNNTKDSEIASRLNVEGTLRTTVTATINAYLDVVSAERTIIIDKEALSRADKSVVQTKLFIKAGHKAGNELITVQANVASAQSQLENDKNNLAQSRYALLSAIGVDPNTNASISSLNVESLIKKYRLPSVDDVKYLVLKNDIQYQVDQMTLHGSSSRSLLVAEDNTRWSLNLNATATTGSATSNNSDNGTIFNQMANTSNQSQSIGLTLQIPIDDRVSKQALMSAKISLKQAELALQQEKWSKETGAINAWNTVVSADRALQFAVDAENLQKKTYLVSYQKYLHGLIDSLELQTAQIQLIQSQQTLLGAQIGYLKSLVNLDLLIGHTLKTWDVKVRLS